MKKVGLDDYLKKHTAKDLLKLRRINLNSKRFRGLDEWYAAWKEKKYDSAAYIDIKATESKWIAGDKFAAMTFPKIKWLWQGFLARGIITLLSALPKVGKTTLLAHLLKTLIENKEDNKFLGAPVRYEGKILILTEEPPSLVRKRLEKFGLLRQELLIILRINVKDWKDALAQVQRAGEKEKISLAIIDTLAEFWDAKDENDAPGVIRSLQMLKQIAHKQNIGILIVHHARKAPGDYGVAHRGSGAIVGFVDIGFELRHVKKSKFKRALISRSRFEETPPELVVELRQDKYVALGSPELFKREGLEQRILLALPAPEQPPISRKQLAELLSPKPGITLLKEILAQNQAIERIGSGTRNDPILYRKKSKEISTSKFQEQLSPLQPSWQSARNAVMGRAS